MVGQRYSPEELTNRLRRLIRDEIESVPTASIGRLKSLDTESRRGEIETVPDGAVETNVPIASTFAGDGMGDLRPIDPAERDDPVFGVVVYTHHPLDRQLSAHGRQFDGERDHEEENAVFMPAQIWFDGDAVPSHDGTERRIDHPDGARVELDEATLEVVDQLGAGFFVESSPEPDLPPSPKDEDAIVDDPIEEWGEEWVKNHLWPDNTAWPIDDEAEDDSAAVRMKHPDGPGVTAVDRGVAIEGSERVSAGRFNDGDRQPLAGKFQHFHPIHHPDGTTSLAGPQLTFREFIAWMTDDQRQEQLRNAEAYREARQYAVSYLHWLEDEVGREIDPTDPDDWPDPEPMPTGDERRPWLEWVPPVVIATGDATATTMAGEVSVTARRFSDGYAQVLPTSASATTAEVAVSAGTVRDTLIGAGAPSAATTTPVPSLHTESTPGTFVDDFTHQSLDTYYPTWDTYDSSDWEITTAWGDESAASLRPTTTDGTTNQLVSWHPDDPSYGYSGQDEPLNYYPKPGDTIHATIRVTVSNDGSYNGIKQVPRFVFGKDGTPTGIGVQLNQNLQGAPALIRDQYNDTTLASDEIAPIDAPATLEWIIDWRTDYYIVADLYNRTTGSHLTTLEAQGPSPANYSISFRDENEASEPAAWDAIWVE